MDIRQSKPYATHMVNLGWQVEKIDGIYCYLKKFPLLGHFCKIQRPAKISPTLINQIKNKYHPFQIIIEPICPIKLNFSQTSPFSPSKTLQLNLIPSADALHQALPKETRRTLRQTQNLTITPTNNLPLFHQSFKAAVGFKRHVPSLKNLTSLSSSFGPLSLFLITDDSSAGAVFLKTKSTGYYWLAFTSKEGRASKAQYQILWQGLLWAKKTGCHTFDFEGIYDNRFPDKKWHGFTHFKKGFGSQEVVYPGTFSKLYPRNLLSLKRRKKSDAGKQSRSSGR